MYLFVCIFVNLIQYVLVILYYDIDLGQHGHNDFALQL